MIEDYDIGSCEDTCTHMHTHKDALTQYRSSSVASAESLDPFIFIALFLILQLCVSFSLFSDTGAFYVICSHLSFTFTLFIIDPTHSPPPTPSHTHLFLPSSITLTHSYILST